MSTRNKDYKRLPGTGQKFMSGRYTLWLGPDHLLHVRSVTASEEYKRFAYADIQALMAFKSHRGKFQNALLLVLMVIFGMIGYPMDFEGRATFGVIIGFLALILLINISRGPTCRAYVQTAVQREELPSVGRFGTYRRMLQRIRPHIEAAQGQLDPMALAEMQPVAQPRPAARPHVPAEPVRPGDPRWHRRLFIALLADGLVGLSVFYAGWIASGAPADWGWLFRVVGIVTTVLVVVFALAAIVRQQNTDLTPGIKKLAWAGLGYVCLDLVLAWVFWVIAAFQNVGDPKNASLMIRMWTEPNLFFPEWFQYLMVGLTVLAFLLAVIGLTSVRRPRTGEA